MIKPKVIVPAALLLAGIAAAAVLVRPSAAVPSQTFVAGVAVGGLGDAALRAALDGPVRRQVERPVRVRVGKTHIEVRPDTLGIRFDADATRRALERSWLRWPTSKRRDVTPVVTVDATVTRAELDERLRDFQRPARNRSVVLAAPEVVLDGKQDLSYTASQRGVTVDEGAAGQAVDTAAAADLLTTAVRAGHTTVQLPVTRVAPGDDTPKLAGVDQLIGTFTTYHPCCAPRVTNIHRIARLIDGTVVAPGATFSLNDAAGERTAANGFVAAPAIVDGELEDQLGGGVSQFSTTLFNATWFAGLDLRRHQPHSLYISRYPPGREATLDWRSIDQVFVNNTEAPIVIRARTTDTSVTVGLYGHTGDRVVDSVTGPRQAQAGDSGGFSVRVQRTIHQDGASAGTDTLRWTYRGLD
ncbi:vancomycin resistance protein YoaR [Actinoplanes lutulentus]|uniref:VanW like protein n=1 Tax=Actinoplanes lutulentus TaxID=1287878 RepID=A0A327Z4F7_9ACTN|nr:VanW family protein [Actinoplanes lutulentus]MBB2947010.1 vancomycin resistance protein YoaR [Actinoplanes lutulentus]RAK30511.1 VanW like protein [Actinoplanes lutulentus]